MLNKKYLKNHINLMTKTSLLLIIFPFMMMTTILFIITLNILHPIYLIILLIWYSLLTCFLMSIWSTNFMYSIILFMIMISGLLIIFLYFSSLISNEQNKIMPWNPFLLISFMLNFIIMFILFFIFSHYLFLNSNSYSLISSPMFISLSSPLFSNIIKIFNYPNNILTLISMFYLLIALFTIIKICSLKSSSLRKIN
uniref:NADH dehydrogenase subunit 6 n=1 Tax=Crematogaster teranishii TaxID=2586727 RepID=A0A7L8Y483_9HYME|nr:NADH dehydrogenase subunit 6 [Crematogaster teranishii]QOI14042.1 NADH dehydrogenase subunit 6 [Crematogaster teranishii]